MGLDGAFEKSTSKRNIAFFFYLLFEFGIKWADIYTYSGYNTGTVYTLKKEFYKESQSVMWCKQMAEIVEKIKNL